MNEHSSGLGAGLAVFVWLSSAHANSGCPLTLEPPEASAAWHDKTREAKGVFAKPPRHQHDCRSVRIEVQREGNALLTFTTTDGRIAVRLLHSPDDIPPTLEALLVTLPVETPIESPLPAKKADPKSAPAPVKAFPGPPEPALSLPLRPSAGIMFESFAGARFGIGGGYFSPVLGLRATMQLMRWEMGIRGEWNPLYVPLVISAPSGFAMYSFQAHLFAGRREKIMLGAFQYGVSMGLAAVHAEIDANSAVKGKLDIDAFQPRLGMYGGFVIPRDGKLRFNVGLFGDMAIWGLRAKATVQRNLPVFPRFGLGVTVGMEVAP